MWSTLQYYPAASLGFQSEDSILTRTFIPEHQAKQDQFAMEL
jgi:hypothetical protein